MVEAAVLERNLSAVASARVRSVILGAPTEPAVAAVRARSGPTVPMVQTETGVLHLNSRYDPLREAERLANEIPAAETVVLVGMDGGFLPRALLAHGIDRLLVVEPDVGMLRGILSIIDVGDIISDRRVHLAVGTEGLGEWLSSRYLPVLHGDARLLVPPGRRKLPSSAVPDTRSRVMGILDGIAGDYATQAKFGRVWARNIVLGLARSGGVREPLPRVRRAAVVAAGPSLDGQISEVREGTCDVVVSVDTALPALRRRGVDPDYVISIDPQPIGYHHYMQGVSTRTTVVTDVGSPHIGRRLLFSGGHPLARGLGEYGLRLPNWDTSGGSVTQTAVDFCRAMGVREVRLFGADYSYGSGAAYARGSYVFDVFGGRATRYRPVSSQATGFVLDRSQRRDGRYRSPLLDRYAARFSEWCRIRGVDVTKPAESSAGSPATLSLPANREVIESYSFSDTAAVGALVAYSKALSELSISQISWPVDFDGLDADRARVLVTLLPLAAWCSHRGSPGPAALSEAKSITFDYLRAGIRLHPQR